MPKREADMFSFRLAMRFKQKGEIERVLAPFPLIEIELIWGLNKAGNEI